MPTTEEAKARARAILAQIDLGDWSPAGSHLSEGIARVYADGYGRALRLVGYRTGAETINQARANLGRKPVAHGDVSPFGRPRRLARAALDGQSVDQALRKDLAADLAADEERRRLAREQAEADADIGVSVDLVNERAAKWAERRAAALVTQISDNTREMLVSAVSKAIEEGQSAVQLAETIHESVGFGDARALTIARTELMDAYGKSTLDAYKAGGVPGKSWLTGGDPCPECQANEDEGPIPIDDDFQSGDDAPTAHPRCECALMPEFLDEGEE